MLLKRDEVQNPKPEPLQALSSFKRASVVDSALNYSIKEAPHSLEGSKAELL